MMLTQTIVAGLGQDCVPHAVVTDKIAAALVVKHLGDVVRYDRDRRIWFKWTGTHWSDRLDHEVRFAFYEACSIMAHYAARGGLSAAERKRLGSERFARSVETIARHDAVVSVATDEWDANPWLLGTPGGTVDLRTGKVIPADPAEMISRLTIVAPAKRGTPTPEWDKFLDQVTVDDKALQAFLHSWLGISATGTVTEQRFAFIHGPGGNGKGVFLRTASRLLGPSAISADPKLFIAKRSEAHPTGLARLQGARMIVGVEVPKDSSWDIELVKLLTGGDEIVARFMHKDFVTFRPRGTITISGNPKPALESTDRAIRRRLLLVPFLFVLAEKDQVGDLEDKLIAAEGPGILRKIIDGAAAWHAAGCKLVIPQTVLDASAEYIDEEDAVGAFVHEECHLGVGFEVSTADLYRAFVAFQGQRRGKVGTINPFSAQIAELPDIQRVKRKDFRGFSGIKLKDFVL